MCGIMGYVGHQEATPILLEGLHHLEYRGYDSAGIAVLDQAGTLIIKRAAGKLSALVSQVNQAPPSGVVGIGHTRWATHGKPSEENAHPHTDCSGQVVVIHNGIIENYTEIKSRLLERGHKFTSQTDTETLAHLIEDSLQEGQELEDAFRTAVAQVKGASAIIALWRGAPDKLVAARLGNAGGLVVGHGKGEMYLASDLPALLPYTREITFLASTEMAVVTSRGVSFTDIGGKTLQKEVQRMLLDPVAATKGGYKHFILKEIMEQPESVTNVLRGRLSFEPPDIHLDEIPYSEEVISNFKRVHLVGMGTSLHAAMLGRLFFEQLAGLPAEAENSSEFRYRKALMSADTLFISVAQSGETVDTLGAMEEAQRKGLRQITICNIEGSQSTRIADGTVYIRAGLEVGVASTKCFANSIVALLLLAAHFGKVRGVVDTKQVGDLVQELTRLPSMLGRLLEREREYERLANQYHRFEHFLYLGRGTGYPIAMEGALKLKELSYIHAEGYQAGEMKHGPIALIDEHMPTVAIATRDDLYEKMLGNISELRARNGSVIAVATEGDQAIGEIANDVVFLPAVSSFLLPVVSLIPLQMLAYHIALRRGCDVDQPRNLAKTVTVE